MASPSPATTAAPAWRPLSAATGFDLATLRQHVHTHLLPNARPLFIRLQDRIDATSTFKQRKIDLVQEGFDPDTVRDPLYFDDWSAGAYLRLDAALYRLIQSGKVRL